MPNEAEVTSSNFPSPSPCVDNSKNKKETRMIMALVEAENSGEDDEHC